MVVSNPASHILMSVGCLVLLSMICATSSLSAVPQQYPPPQGLLLSGALGDHMVLQRDSETTNVWGWSYPEASIVVTVTPNTTVDSTSFSTASTLLPAVVSTQADDFTGAWTVALTSTPAGGPYDVQIMSKSLNGTLQTQTLVDVYFGDVFLCGGQSNMMFTVAQAFNGSQAIANAINYPLIRVMTVSFANRSSVPLANFMSIEEGWSVGSPISIGHGSWYYFSATCWFTAVNLFDYLETDNASIPIGLVSDNVGGTTIEEWSSPDALEKCDRQNMYDASTLYNAMIYPLLNMRFLAALWWQAEANTIIVNPPYYNNSDAEMYACMFPNMIKNWRQQFNQTLPFFFVQLQPYTEGVYTEQDQISVATMRLSQLSALALDNTGFVSAVDIGDISSPDTNIHPRNKELIGKRMAWVLEALVYQNTSVVYLGPMAESASFLPLNTSTATGNSTLTAEITFAAESLSGGLTFHELTCLVNASQCGWYAMADDSGNSYNATASIDSTATTLLISVTAATSAVEAITSVSYLMNTWPVATLYNGAGLPATPFYLFP
eukprot:TRINITY_DN10680_c0_g1_i1.p1 TRINITY_DN10680_c0_g1~~TRINITY_DN10680_c0_g1_i1.p1  ORF type:complete len:582 (+),score=80.16 TRINITY_DN10680_c0_g1_i1:97-1746(+)